MSDLFKNQVGVLKKLSRRNWLRNASFAVIGASMLLLTGCSKEEPIPPLLGGAPNAWYKIKVNYRTTKGATTEGYFAPIGRWGDWTTPYYSEMRVDNSVGMKFKRHPATQFGQGWEFLEAEDGTFLNLGYDGWVYRDTEKEIAWMIVNGKLIHNYSRWEGYYIGAQERGNGVTNPFNVRGYYAGVGLGDQYELTNVQFVPAD